MNHLEQKHAKWTLSTLTRLAQAAEDAHFAVGDAAAEIRGDALALLEMSPSDPEREPFLQNTSEQRERRDRALAARREALEGLLRETQNALALFEEGE